MASLGEDSVECVRSPSAPQPPLAVNISPFLSPSIQRVAGEKTGAFEVKFLITDALAQQVQDWAVRHMMPDAYADPALNGAYQTTTLYLDTPEMGVFNRVNGHRKTKYRLRRYGVGERIYLERKTRRGDRVSKRRCDVPAFELSQLTCPAADASPGDDAAIWHGVWFRERVVAYPLQPSCRLTYDRCAFVKGSEEGPMRLTLDRHIRGHATDAWDLTPVDEGHAILPGEVICEFKFRQSMPGLFKELIQLLKLEAGSVSKYRRMMTAAGMVPLVSAPQPRAIDA